MNNLTDTELRAKGLMSEGVIVKLSISQWSARIPFDISMLGLKLDEDTANFFKNYISTGRAKICTHDLLSNLEYLNQKSRKNLCKYGFDLKWGTFVPFTALEEWEKENESHKEMFNNCA